MSSHHTLSSYLVSPAELNSALKHNASKLSTESRIIPLCASWFLPNDGRNGYDTFVAEHIPHARFFDLDAVKDIHSPYPHMLPSAEEFADAMSHLGIRREDSVVVYDTKELGIFSAPRVGWTLRVFEHPKVHVLNNFRKWVEEGYPTESGEPKDAERTEYAVPELQQGSVVAFEEMRDIAKELGKEGAEEVQILDARSLGRWKGVDPEPREGAFELEECLTILTSSRSLIRTYPAFHVCAHHRPPRSKRQDPPPSFQTPGSLQVQGRRSLKASDKQLRHRCHSSSHRRCIDRSRLPHTAEAVIRR
jgi:3-mercaptopyruvate sulfurtransferase SseA